MVKQLEAHSYEEPKLWSSVVLCQKQIMNARREIKERNLTWRIQEDNKCWTHLEHFPEAKWCVNQMLQTVRESELKCRSYNHWKPITPSQRPISQLQNYKVLAAKLAFGCEMETFSLRNFAAHLACLLNPPECFQIFATDSFRFFLQIFVV